MQKKQLPENVPFISCRSTLNTSVLCTVVMFLRVLLADLINALRVRSLQQKRCEILSVWNNPSCCFSVSLSVYYLLINYYSSSSSVDIWTPMIIWREKKSIRIFENLYSPSKHGREQTTSNTNQINNFSVLYQCVPRLCTIISTLILLLLLL